MLRVVLTVCLLLCLSTDARPQAGRRAWLNGTWEGTGYQIDTDSTWTMKLTARGRRYGVEYPSLNCVGVWRLLSINSRRATFREHITRGRADCAEGGSVVVERLGGGQVAYRYSHRGERAVSASAILNRKR